MNPDSKLLLDEMHRLFNEQKTQIEDRFTEADQKLDLRFIDSSRLLEKRFVDVDKSVTKHLANVDDSLNKRLTEVDDTLNKRLADSDLSWERRITNSELHQNNLIAEAERRQDDRIFGVMKVAGALESWRQDSEGAMDDLKLKVDKLTKYWDRSFLDNATASTGLISQPPSALEQTAARSSANLTAARPSGHHVETTPRADGIGENSSQSHSPANGMHSKPKPEVLLFHGEAYDVHTRNHPPDPNPPNLGKLLKQNFPIYEGETTRLWISQAEDYFDMYEVPPRQWVKISHMNFHGAVGRWIESIPQPDRLPWPDFCKMLHDRFGRDQRDKLVMGDKAPAKGQDDKLSTLRAYCRAQGLCEVCAEKWGHPFQHDLKILQLDSDDLILGMDWLERYSPMEIHWKAKWISIPCDGTQLVLHGLSATSTVDMVF
ncbi:unnamed protein product [Miscanthus lutarioriparius]|uniref:Uncharacterized protein n=1 Tax=Miscanthus lutarioriparius TaxID=422564 RepID=A0A811NCG6_9POAL|nr:unnamed protein product [Miscanthus lutarioriparius]